MSEGEDREKDVDPQGGDDEDGDESKSFSFN